MVRFQVVLDPIEASVLADWAESELRDPRDQIRFVLRNELDRLGLLPMTQNDEMNTIYEGEAGENE